MIERPRPKLDDWLEKLAGLIGTRSATDDERARFKKVKSTSK